MNIQFNGRYFYVTENGSAKPLMALDLVSRSDEFQFAFPRFEISESYWEISIGYIHSSMVMNGIDLEISITNQARSHTVAIPQAMPSDYFIVEHQILPISGEDREVISDLCRAWHQDSFPGLSTEELLSFEYLAIKHRLQVKNSIYRDSLMANPKFLGSQFRVDLQVEPYPYQSIGIQWLSTQQNLGRSGVILGDMMGLGKTLQAIGLVVNNIANGRADNLVICPGTLIENWQREIIKFAPHLKVLKHAGPMRTGTSINLLGFDVVLMSYETMLRDCSFLVNVPWNLVILDEAQAIKNPNSKRARHAKEIPREFGVAITGTPLENRLLDLWSLTEFADPTIFGSKSEFENEFEGDGGRAMDVHQYIRPILLRRKLEDIEHQLPELITINHPLQWPPELNSVYEEIRQRALDEFPIAGGFIATGRLRLLATHPRLVGIETKDLFELSPKYQLTFDILQELVDNNEKALIFTNSVQMIRLIQLDLESKFPQAFIDRLYGDVPMDSRTPLIDSFNEFNGPGVLICNPSVAGAGLNIVGANHVIHYNLEWNPAKEDQATYRVYRNGQTRTTFVHRPFYLDTIDEVIDLRIQMKRELSDLGVDAKISTEEYKAALLVSPVGEA